MEVRPELQKVLDHVNVWLEEKGLKKYMVNCVLVGGGESIIVNAPGVPDHEVLKWMDQIQNQIDLALRKYNVQLKRPDWLEQRIAKRKKEMEESGT